MSTLKSLPKAIAALAISAICTLTLAGVLVLQKEWKDNTYHYCQYEGGIVISFPIATATCQTTIRR